VALPLIFKESGSGPSQPPQTEIVIKSINTGGATVRILDPNGQELLACTIPDNTTQSCGKIDTISTYQVTAQTGKCGPLGPATFNDGVAGKVTRSIFCN
jgi:hypothetical protein